MMRKILVVSPHPDDAELGLGGMIHRRCASGDKVTVAVCTGDGDLRMAHSGRTVPFSQRMDEQVTALRALGTVEVVWLGLASASNFDQTPQSKIVSAFDDLFSAFDEVYLPLPSYNMDHEIVWKAGLSACRPGRNDRVQLVAYEQPNQGHGEQIGGRIMGKRYFALTGHDVRAKVKAVLSHESQMNGRQMSIYGESGIVALARLRGLEIGKHYAEMVYPLREIV